MILRYIILLLSSALLIATIIRAGSHIKYVMDYITPALWALSITVFFTFSMLRAYGYSIPIDSTQLNYWSMINQMVGLIYVFVVVLIYSPEPEIYKEIDNLENSITDKLGEGNGI